MQFMRLVAVCAFAALGCGCGQAKHSVSGKVAFSDGKPAYEGTMVIFTSADRLQSGIGVVVGSEGKFPAVSFEESGDGLPPGTYSVAVRPPDPRTVPPEVAKTAPPNFGIDQRYTVDETSGLTVKVESDVKDLTLTLDPTKGPPGGVANNAAFVEMMQGGAKDRGSDR